MTLSSRDDLAGSLSTLHTFFMVKDQGKDLLVREPMLEGIWYPEGMDELIDALHQVHGAPAGDILPLVISVPTGPLDEVGSVMGPALASAAGHKYDRVFLAGRCELHHPSRLYVPESAAFRSPLGLSMIDGEALGVILDSSMLVERNDLPHLEENTFELVLAFLHYHLGNIPILPVLAGDKSDTLARSVAGALRLLRSELGGRSLVVSVERQDGRPGRGDWQLENLIILPDGVTFGESPLRQARWTDPDNGRVSRVLGMEHHGPVPDHRTE